MSIPEEPEEEERYQNEYNQENREFTRYRSPEPETESDSDEEVSRNYDEEYGIDRVPERRLYDSE